MSGNGVKMVLIPARECSRCFEGLYIARADGTDYYDCGHHDVARDVEVTEAQARAMGYGK